MSAGQGVERRVDIDGNEWPRPCEENTMPRAQQVKAAIYGLVLNVGECTFEQLVKRLGQFSWNEIFSTVDQLSREGTLTLRRPSRFGFVISAAPQRSRGTVRHQPAGDNVQPAFSRLTS